MKLSKVIASLDEKAIQKLKEYVISPFFRVDDSSRLLIEKIIQKLDQDKIIDKEEIWKQIFGKEIPYDDAKIRIIATRSIDHIETFLAVQKLQGSASGRLKFCVDMSSDQGLNSLETRHKKSIEAWMDEKHIRTPEDIYFNYSTMKRIVELTSSFERKKSLKRNPSSEFNIRQLNKNLNSLYLCEKIRIALLAKIYKEVNTNMSFNVDIDIQNYLNELEIDESNVFLQLYRKVFFLVVATDHQKKKFDLGEFIKNLSEIYKNYPFESTELYDSVYNYYVWELNKGNDVYGELFELIDFGMTSKLLLKQDLLDPTDYRNAVIVACRCNEYDWALNFVEEYKSHLAPEYRRSAYSFNKARIHMNMHNYEEAVDMLRDVEYEDVTYNINSKLMLMHAFYELDEYDVLESTIKAFKVFLRRRRNISKSRKANFTDHCDVLYHIIKASERRDPKRLFQASKILDNNPAIPNKFWLRERIDEIGKNLGIKEGLEV